MAHCLEHTQDKAFLVYSVGGIKPRVALIRGSLQFPIKSFFNYTSFFNHDLLADIKRECRRFWLWNKQLMAFQ